MNVVRKMYEASFGHTLREEGATIPLVINGGIWQIVVWTTL